MHVIFTLFTATISILHIHALPNGYKQSFLQIFIECLLFSRPCFTARQNPCLHGTYILVGGADNNKINYIKYQKVIMCYGEKAKALACGGVGVESTV